MSKESYARGFVKAAEAAGVDPAALAKYASVTEDNMRYYIDDSLADHNQYLGAPKPALADTIPGIPKMPKKPTLLTNPGKLGVEANKRMMDEYTKAIEEYEKALKARDSALEDRRKAIIANAAGEGTVVPPGVPREDLATWYEYGVPSLAAAIARGRVPNQKYDYTSGTNAMTQAVYKELRKGSPQRRNIIEAIRRLGHKYDYGPFDLYEIGRNMRQ